MARTSSPPGLLRYASQSDAKTTSGQGLLASHRRRVSSSASFGGKSGWGGLPPAGCRRSWRVGGRRWTLRSARRTSFDANGTARRPPFHHVCLDMDSRGLCLSLMSRSDSTPRGAGRAAPVIPGPLGPRRDPASLGCRPVVAGRGVPPGEPRRRRSLARRRVAATASFNDLSREAGKEVRVDDARRHQRAPRAPPRPRRSNRPHRGRRGPGPAPDRSRDPRAQQGCRRPRPARHPEPRRRARLPPRRPHPRGRGRRRALRVASTPRCTATTCAPSRPAP